MVAYATSTLVSSRSKRGQRRQVQVRTRVIVRLLGGDPCVGPVSVRRNTLRYARALLASARDRDCNLRVRYDHPPYRG